MDVTFEGITYTESVAEGYDWKNTETGALVTNHRLSQTLTILKRISGRKHCTVLCALSRHEICNGIISNMPKGTKCGCECHEK